MLGSGCAPRLFLPDCRDFVLDFVRELLTTGIGSRSDVRARGLRRCDPRCRNAMEARSSPRSAVAAHARRPHRSSTLEPGGPILPISINLDGRSRDRWHKVPRLLTSRAPRLTCAREDTGACRRGLVWRGLQNAVIISRVSHYHTNTSESRPWHGDRLWARHQRTAQ